MWAQKGLLISLDDEGVSLFHLTTLKIHCQANRTRYAQCFAWNPRTAMLAVAVKRKVLLFHYNGNEFVELKDLSMADNAQCMSWIGEHICIGHKKEYVLEPSFGFLQFFAARNKPLLCWIVNSTCRLAHLL